MNAPFASPLHRFTVTDILHLVEKGVIHEDAKFELVEGEIVPKMSPKGIAHERMKMLLTDWLVRSLGDKFWVMVETTLYLSKNTFLEPDFVLVSRKKKLVQSPVGADVALAIEVYDTSKAYDLGRKAGLYARYGVGEYWAIDAYGSGLRVHRGADPKGWTTKPEDVKPDTPIAPLCAKGVALKLSDLKD
ncbi:MAG: Uma2 family endonuclease [Hyphomonadaceae bacterium]|nr:Uma2 family endonuclease [Hyphomonadaceae bacterium]